MSQRRSALGRGLGALISNPSARSATPETAPEPSPVKSSTPKSVNTKKSNVDSTLGTPAAAATAAQAPPARGAQEISVQLIDPNPEQPRREFKQEALEQLSRSIGQHGVLQPVVVRRAGDRYELIMGERRFRASQLAGRKTVPAVIADVDPDDRLELAIVENVQRQDLNPIELALAYQALSDAGNTQDEIGRKVAMDRSSIANHLRLLDLSRAIQADVERGKLSMGHAKALLQVADVEVREALRGQILGEGLSVRAAERRARELSGAGPSRRKAPKPAEESPALDADTRAFVERIERRLQTKVALHRSSDGSGRLEIKYFDLEDLDRLGNLLLGEAH